MNPMSLQYQAERVRRAEKDTYKVRKKEGRSKHGRTSVAVIILGLLAWCFQAMAVVSEQWRTSWVGILGYSSHRSWGLLAVRGASTQMHHELAQQTCSFYGQLLVGSICASPICLWYKAKCKEYSSMVGFSYGAAFFLVLELFMHSLCLIWTFLFRPRLIRWAGLWWPICAIVHIACLSFWYCTTENMFENLNQYSFYPTPPAGVGMIISSIAAFCLCVNTFLGFTLMAMWPEVDIEDLDSDSDGSRADAEEEEEGDEAFLKHKAKTNDASPMASFAGGTAFQARGGLGMGCVTAAGKPFQPIGHGMPMGAEQYLGSPRVPIAGCAGLDAGAPYPTLQGGTSTGPYT